MKTEGANPGAWPALEKQIDDSVIATVRTLLESRRRAIGGAAPRGQWAAELRFCERLSEAVRGHLEEVRRGADESAWAAEPVRVVAGRQAVADGRA